MNGSDCIILSSIYLSLVYQKAMDFYKLILYPATLLKVLIIFTTFWALSCVMSLSTERESLTSHFYHFNSLPF